jgi:hypothetical protein
MMDFNAEKARYSEFVAAIKDFELAVEAYEVQYPGVEWDHDVIMAAYRVAHKCLEWKDVWEKLDSE